MICENSIKNEFKKHYNCRVLKKWESCELVVEEINLNNK